MCCSTARWTKSTSCSAAAPAYVEESRHSCFTAEVHVRYLRELHAGDPVRVTFQLLDYDAKRLHYFEQLFHAVEGWLSATSENMALHVDMAAKKTAPFPERVAARLARMKAAHAHLPVPEAAGRRIAMRGKACISAELALNGRKPRRSSTMGAPQLNIKDTETTRLVRELVELTGETQTEVVRKALRERLQREKAERESHAARTADEKRREFERVWPKIQKIQARVRRGGSTTTC